MAETQQPEGVGPEPTAQDRALLDDLAGAKVLGGEFWTPEKVGTTIVGEILLDEMSEGQYGEQRVLQLAVGSEVRLVAVNQSLARELAREKAVLGDRIGIQFRGLVKTHAGRDFKTYVARKVRK